MFENNCVLFKWDLTDLLAEIRFFGDGIWSYEVTTPTKHAHFKGLGYPMTQNGEDKYFTYEKNKSPYIFVLDDDFEKHVTLEDEFQNIYEPVYRKADRSVRGHSVSIMWTTNVYDGPLAGYCYHNNKLHFFDLAEETDISGKRIYAIYEINLWERAKAYISHWNWMNTTTIRPLWNFYMFRYNLRQKYENWRYGKDHYKVVLKEQEDWKTRHKLVGFFS